MERHSEEIVEDMNKIEREVILIKKKKYQRDKSDYMGNKVHAFHRGNFENRRERLEPQNYVSRTEYPTRKYDESRKQHKQGYRQYNGDRYHYRRRRRSFSGSRQNQRKYNHSQQWRAKVQGDDTPIKKYERQFSNRPVRDTTKREETERDRNHKSRLESNVWKPVSPGLHRKPIDSMESNGHETRHVTQGQEGHPKDFLDWEHKRKERIKLNLPSSPLKRRIEREEQEGEIRYREGKRGRIKILREYIIFRNLH
ncbi:Hypothetical predicted protein [Pelobates cultripes]|uniref:Uncharacterized protein n=1 Tax=Pelobates cultripes TaxID=61616 RepID=A0AAD1T4T2_PELCU|nr:Hypothetical predicted protein [Pelobates cultripes]